MKLWSKSHEDTLRIGEAIAALAFPGLVVALNGDLGAGKTVLAKKGVGSGLDVPDVITSPTFVLMQLYESGRIPFVHADLYRLSDYAEALELGMEELMSSAVVLLEWPQRIPELIPEEHLWIDIVTQGTTRVLELHAHGARIQAVVQELATNALSHLLHP